VTLRGQKPLPKAYPQALKTLGDHLRKRRLDLKLLQKEVAEKLGVEEATVWNWENNYSSPKLRYIPEIIRFLGYMPFKEPETFGQKIVNYRCLFGITQKELAKSLGVDPSTLGRWERNKSTPRKELFERLEARFHFPADRSFTMQACYPYYDSCHCDSNATQS